VSAIVPVVIVGAGPTGVAAATALAQHAVRSLLFERYPQQYALPRAVHLDDEVMRILQQLGVAEGFAAISRPARGLRLLDAGHRVIAEFHRDLAQGVHGHPQANLFDQPDLERLLRRNLSRYREVELRTGIEVVGLEPGPAPADAGQPAPTRVRFRNLGDGVEGSTSGPRSGFRPGTASSRSVIRPARPPSCGSARTGIAGSSGCWLASPRRR
jgi:3-(3-hydroxy-phenyl)propionate hydroxylase